MMLVAKASWCSASLAFCFAEFSSSRRDASSSRSSRMFMAESICPMAATIACSKFINIAVISASINRAEEPNVSLICSRALDRAALARLAYRSGSNCPACQKT
jgi:hypothetical protein